MQAALAAFGGSFGSQVVQGNTDRTKTTDNGIISYDMYFVLSAVDYFVHSNDVASLVSWAPLIEKKFATSVAFWKKPTAQNFCGSDSRIGADFEHSPPFSSSSLHRAASGPCAQSRDQPRLAATVHLRVNWFDHCV